MKDSLIAKYSGDDRGQDLLSSFLLTLPANTNTFDKHNIQYHQADVDNSSCVFHAALTCLSNLWGIEVPIERCIELIEGAKSAGVLSVSGADLYKGVDFTRRRWNLRYPKNKTNSVRLPTIGGRATILFNLGYMGQTGRRLFKEYTEDLRDDGVLNSVETAPQKAGYHSTTLYKESGDMKVVNSYKNWTSQPNIYRVEKLRSKVINGIFLQQSYFWLPKDILESAFKSFKDEYGK